MLQRTRRRLIRSTFAVLRSLGLRPAESSLFAPGLATASMEDVAAAHRVLFGREIDPAARDAYAARLARRPLRFEELAEELLHSPEFTARFGRLAPSADEEVVEAEVEGVIVLLRRHDALIGRPVRAGQPHEPEVWAALRSLLAAGRTFVDVGANVGLFALPAARVVGAAGRVIAVEPVADNVRLLGAAVARNGLDNVDIYPFAASDRRGVIAVVTRQATSNSFTPPDRAVHKDAPCAPCAPLDDLLLGYPRIDVVKVDVEGHEPAVLAGARSLLERHRPTLLVEFNPAGLETNFGRDPGPFADSLLDYGEGEVMVVVREAEAVSCKSGAAILRAWEAANERLGLDGRLHVDVLARPRARARP